MTSEFGFRRASHSCSRATDGDRTAIDGLGSYRQPEGAEGVVDVAGLVPTNHSRTRLPSWPLFRLRLGSGGSRREVRRSLD
jgi:hypothetical protein